MPTKKILQPVLKAKVDQLFLYWLSETPTQLLLKDYLRRIKNGENVMADTFEDGADVSLSSSNKLAHKSVDNLSLSPGTPCSPPSRSPSSLPIGPCGSPRSLFTPRTRKSIGSKLVPPSREEPRTPVLSQNIPKFYFPKGCPKGNVNIDAIILKIEKTFSAFPNERATLEDMGKVAKACDCPLYWKAPLFYSAGGERTGCVSVHKFVAMWRKVLHTCHDDAAKFLQLLAKPGCSYLEQEDFILFLQDVVNTHPHLTFLREASEFHSRYITTVVQRIFYNVNRSWSGRITCGELGKSNLLQHVALLEEEDINQSTDYFSYEHFYVIYCKFWELDTDHDLYIDEQDLSKHNDHAISSRIIERIFSGAVTRGRKAPKEGKISYADFVWFLLSEEDKRTRTSIEYWFRCMDLDGDGVLSMYELEYFYEEQCQKMESMAIEPLSFEDCLCQMLDLVKPHCDGKITLHDLKKCKQANLFLDTFLNLDKYLDHEQKEPFSAVRVETEGQELTDWEKYAAEEYAILVAEEAATEQWNDGYDAELNALETDLVDEKKYGMDKRPYLDMASEQSQVDLEEYEYEDDFE
ncbi:PREDICTED: serine/threonine-protein phosphatase 2A regulatory subunit B'' subunit beta-like isoform X1 [Nanorana parkeri]|uniref:serine/threonine-protein phosphatase 2A regulatory subunit B'' subunit beta-like isoform X1 n=1 Tax=Nanorana parkeri TaxID=125878 RepID=UPI0008547BB7|nr:PREDICTED: serine/threonine-protein phosphatase 2A regulatory subunit B'' subunit beta-like isoform X1 [Nanorana parkeri]